MKTSERATLTKRLIKQYGADRSKWTGITIKIPLDNGYEIKYHSGGARRSHQGFSFSKDGTNLCFITYGWGTREYYYLATYLGYSMSVTKEQFHDFLHPDHKPLKEWCIWNGL